MTEPAVSVADIEAAERVLGIVYTPAERALMIGNIEGQIASARLRRTRPIANSTPMASKFDPRLPNFSMPAAQGIFRSSTPPPMPLPNDDEDIAYSPVTELAAWIAAGTLTSRRLTEIYLGRIETLNPRLECYATVSTELALAEADAADALLRGGVNLGPLHGVPYGIKDLFDTKDIVTGWGAEPYRDRGPR